jgi:hypothetical protein
MRTNIFIFFSFFAFIFISCKKDNNGLPPDPAPEADYTMIHTGQYWVYEYYRIDTTGAEEKLESTDSAYILKDTLIDGIQYYVHISHPLQFTKSGILVPWADTAILRDSSGYLLKRIYDGSTSILFARDNFTDILYSDTIDVLFILESRMVGKDSLVTVPAGTFTTRSMCTSFFPQLPDYPWGFRRSFNIYAKEIGLIKYQYFFASQPSYYEARLVRCNYRLSITR